jgi:hypothetical protein
MYLFVVGEKYGLSLNDFGHCINTTRTLSYKTQMKKIGNIKYITNLSITINTYIRTISVHCITKYTHILLIHREYIYGCIKYKWFQ